MRRIATVIAGTIMLFAATVTSAGAASAAPSGPIGNVGKCVEDVDEDTGSLVDADVIAPINVIL
ncbi:hypothetical protein VR41_14525 [Streptomyces sp. NRRL B-1568]|nr:hypothetical protein VR41_14525 [Streptomyces sp. NRRL B-1568]